MSGGMTLSASPMTSQEGIVFHPTAFGALSVKQRAANGRCVAANRAATSAGSADANTVPKYSPQSAVAGRSFRVKPDHLCHWRFGCAAPLVAHQQNYDHTSERRRAKNP